MRVDAFRPKEEYFDHIDNWIKRFRESDTVEGQSRVIIPGDPEREIEKERMNSGIPLLAPVIEDLKKLGGELKVDFPDSV